MRPAEVPDDLVEKVAVFGFDLMAEGGRDIGRWADLPIDDISKDYHRVLARYHLSVVLPEARAKALHEAAEFVDSQRYIDEPADLRQVRDRLHGLADGTWAAEVF